MKELNLNQRYKKLKQSDRMEYMSMLSIFEKRGQTLKIIFWISISIKIALIYISLTIISLTHGVIDYNLLDITLKEFFNRLFFTLFIMSPELVALSFGFVNDLQTNKTLDEYLTEKKV